MCCYCSISSSEAAAGRVVVAALVIVVIVVVVVEIVVSSSRSRRRRRSGSGSRGSSSSSSSSSSNSSRRRCVPVCIDLLSASCRYNKLRDAVGISGLLQELLSKTAENFQVSEARRQEAEARLQDLWATCAENQSQCLMSVCFFNFRPELSGKYDGCDLISRDLH